ncbi:MAG: phosphotransferase [Nitrososphaerales archaeon]
MTAAAGRSDDGTGTKKTEDGESPEERIEMLRRYLEKKYQTSIAHIERLDRGVFRVDRVEGGRWVARVFTSARPLERVLGDAEVLRFLEESGFPAERCVRQGDPVSSAGRWNILLTEFVEGTHPEHDEETLRRLGEALGRLHALPPGTGLVARDAGALHHYVPREGRVRNEIDAARSWLESVEAQVPAQGRSVHASLLRRVESADYLEGLPEALVHPDPVPKNFLATAGDARGPFVLIDWTGAGRGPRLQPIALLVWAGALGDGEWSRGRVDAVVDGYRSHVRLDRDEVARLAAAMNVRPLVFACWRYRFAIRAGKVPDGSEWWMPDERLSEEIASYAGPLLER